MKIDHRTIGYLGFLGFLGPLGLILYSVTGNDLAGMLMGFFVFFGFLPYLFRKNGTN